LFLLDHTWCLNPFLYKLFFYISTRKEPYEILLQMKQNLLFFVINCIEIIVGIGAHSLFMKKGSIFFNVFTSYHLQRHICGREGMGKQPINVISHIKTWYNYVSIKLYMVKCSSCIIIGPCVCSCVIPYMSLCKYQTEHGIESHVIYLCWLLFDVHISHFFGI